MAPDHDRDRGGLRRGDKEEVSVSHEAALKMQCHYIFCQYFITLLSFYYSYRLTVLWGADGNRASAGTNATASSKWAHVARDRKNGGRGGVVGAPGIGGEG